MNRTSLLVLVLAACGPKAGISESRMIANGMVYMVLRPETAAATPTTF